MPGLLRAIIAKRAPLDTGLAQILRHRESLHGPDVEPPSR
jgi:hypothetical protein